MEQQELKNVVEAALLAAGQPLSLDKLLSLFPEEQAIEREALRGALAALQVDYAERSVELVEVGSGWRFQVRSELAPWVSKLWEERPARYSRALLETLALIAYRQPITRAEIEDIRGVTVSSNIVKTLLEREWVRVVGHRDVPGKPAMYATTRQFLDYFNLKSLDALPTLAELRDFDTLDRELQFGDLGGRSQTPAPDPAVEADEAPAAGADATGMPGATETGEPDSAGAAQEGAAGAVDGAPLGNEGAREPADADADAETAAHAETGAQHPADAAPEEASQGEASEHPEDRRDEQRLSGEVEAAEQQEDVADDATPRLTV